MAGPWEQYQSAGAPQQANAGPWTQYQQQTPVGAPAMPQVGDTWTDPETGTAHPIVDPTVLKKGQFDWTPADVQDRMAVLKTQTPIAPLPAPPTSMGQSLSTAQTPEQAAGAANNPDVVKAALAAAPQNQQADAVQILGAQRAEDRGPVGTFAREAVNTAGLGLPRLAATLTNGSLPIPLEHQLEMAADARGATLNPNAAQAGDAAGNVAQGLGAVATGGTESALGAGITNALMGATRTGADTLGDPIAMAKSAIVDGLLGATVHGGLTTAKNAVAQPVESALSRDAIKQASNDAYDQVAGLNVQYAQPSFGKMVQAAGDDVRSEGLDPTLHPRATAALGRLEEAATLPSGPTTQNIDTLRRIVRDAGNTPDEMRLGGILQNHLDNFIQNAGPQDAVSGDPTQVAKLWADARGNWAAVQKSDQIQKLMGRADRATEASGSGANTDNAIRQQFKSVLNNDKAMRGFSPDEAAAMANVIRSQPGQDILRTLGKLSPHHPLTALVAAGAGHAAMGPAGILPLVGGYFAKHASDAMTQKRASIVDALVRANAPASRAAAGNVAQALPVASVDQSNLLPALIRQWAAQNGAPSSNR